ncbi:hypothetical protein [Lewinella cohaerens]|uniref:hypothetical protein n=1 Tax=Lewinella cohaerens TaxID=70995 RepID=UPI00037526AC|nr:hypothetical protein [Lewinella cohaerens]
MDRSSLDFLLEVLEGQRRVFYYAKDEYARYLLERQTLPEAQKLKTIANSRWGRLLDRPLLQKARGNWGDGMLDFNRLQLLRAADPLSFRLSFGQWGQERHFSRNWAQTSRPGYNLVLQLNFASDHNREYQQLVDGTHRHPFKYWGHPSRAAGKEFTLAWARIDLSENLEEALIEEVQTDWWKAANEEVIERRHRKRDANGQWREWTTKRSRHSLEVDKYEHYLQQVLKAYGEVWAEAMLTATLRLLWEEIGVSRIFYHTYDAGCMLKNCKPPKSLYTQLPKRFCFEKTTTHPSFLGKRLQRLAPKLGGQPSFWLL